MSRQSVRIFLLACVVLLGAARGWAQASAPIAPQEPNTDPTYRALRSALTGEVVPVRNLVLARDAGAFTLNGALTFLAPVNGKVTGAVFFGKGRFDLVPPIEVEKAALSQVTKEPALHEEFERAVFRFTDGTYDEVKRATPPDVEKTSGGDVRDLLNSNQHLLRKDFKYNLDARILEDVLRPNPGRLFWAFIPGQHISNKMIYAIDPHGLSPFGVAPEEVVLFTYGDFKAGVWTAFHFSDEYKSVAARGSQYNLTLHLKHQALDVTLDKSGRLDGTARTTFVSTVDGLRVVPFNLFHTLRVRSVLDADGKPLAFIQENKDEDAQFSVILGKSLAKGEETTITVQYGGKEAVIDAGFGNYYPVARTNWYPNTTFGDYATYEMTFRVPKPLTLVATGLPVRASESGNLRVTEWRADVPQAVAGFNFADYTEQEVTLDKEKYKIEGYANTKENAFASLLKRAVGEGQLAVTLYTDYYGPAPYQRLALTEQPTNRFGQSWPGLIYVPHASFLDVYSDAYNAEFHGFWRTVIPHEVAHQWFGHAVGIPSYRDNWLSEGFADFSAALYMQKIYYDKPQVYRDVLKEWKRELLSKSSQGKRPIDVGPVIMGYRLSNTKMGWDVPRLLIYPKGAYILYMLRMMMWSQKTGDTAFKEMMHDYVQSSYNRPTSTEDFKTVVERHMIREMNQTGDGKMDWFFNEWVYGTYLPDYRLESSFSPIQDGFAMTVKLTQSNVDDRFVMPVPIYLDFGNDKVIKLGAVRVVGNNTTSLTVPLTGLSEPPKRVLINYNADVLSTENGKW